MARNHLSNFYDNGWITESGKVFALDLFESRRTFRGYLFGRYHFAELVLRFDRRDKTMIKLIDVHLMCAMAPPVRGGKDVTPRFKRHFVVLTISEFEDEVMTMIFSKIVLWHLDTR